VAGATGAAGATGVAGTTGSAGATGSGGAAGGGGSGAGGSGLPQSAIVVQDKFDSVTSGGAPDAAKWEAYMSWEAANAPTVDNAKYHTAPNAVRVAQTSGSGRGAFLVPIVGFPVAGNAFYVRVFINWDKATTMISGHSGFIVGAAARDNSGTEVRLGLSSKGPGSVPRMDLNLIGATDGAGGEVTRYSNGYTDGGNPGDFPGVGFQFAANRWYCVEAFFNGAASGSEFRVWVDDAELTDMHVTDFRGNTSGAPRTMWAPTYRYLKIGAQTYDADLGRIWYDDVVVATQKVGCSYAVP
jgi:hypothetical protein